MVSSIWSASMVIVSLLADYIIRDLDQAKVKHRKQLMVDAAAYVVNRLALRFFLLKFMISITTWLILS